MANRFNIMCVALLLGACGFGLLTGAAPAWASESPPPAEGAAVSAMTFVKMDPIILPIVDRNGVSQVV